MSNINLVDQVRTSSNDTGSVQVQIAQMTDKIKQIAEHTKIAHKDKSAKRGLEILVGKRRRFLLYLKKNNNSEYLRVTQTLGLRQ